MIFSLRIVTLLLLLRLFLLDASTASDWWSWMTVGFDVLLAVSIFYDREPPVPAKDARTDRDLRR